MKINKLLPNSWVLDSTYDSEITCSELFDIINHVVSHTEYKVNDRITPCMLYTNNIFGSSAYRSMFMLFNGFIWPDPECRHLCGINNCCNPYHLWPGDRYDNIVLDKEFHAKYGTGILAPIDWYKLGYRDTQSVASVFEGLTNTTAWNEFLGWCKDNDKYDPMDKLIQVIHTLSI